MSKSVTLGGDRLGSGKKQKVYLHNYERSTHDLGYLWRSTMAPGTLVPFLKQVALPGDNFKIELNADVKTLPTVGPLFGSFKLQLDVFLCPIRIYNAQLHMNRLGVGMDMSRVRLPMLQLHLPALRDNAHLPTELRHINPSALLSYFGFKGVGTTVAGTSLRPRPTINALPILAYWDIYKNYYANKQQEIGAFLVPYNGTITSYMYEDNIARTPGVPVDRVITANTTTIRVTTLSALDKIGLLINKNGVNSWHSLSDVFIVVTTNPAAPQIFARSPRPEYIGHTITTLDYNQDYISKFISTETFPLSNIDSVKDLILRTLPADTFTLTSASLSPYGRAIAHNPTTFVNNQRWAMSGLALKTYQSDMFNNWLRTEWLDGPTGINAITAISTASGSFNIDTLLLSRKVYDMLNRIAVSGGTYEDWLQAVYSHEPYRRAENPMYMGGMSKEVIFQEVVSRSETSEQPLGSLAGRGALDDGGKGGFLEIRVDEPSYIIGIVSLTPRIDYSQGNDWDIHLRTMNDLHKPALDQIGFQDLITAQMAFWEQHFDSTTHANVFFSAGKQPAWLNYMTNYNRCYGNFANPQDQMFMTLNRRYEHGDLTTQAGTRIRDLTTYIDPIKFNYIFADTQRDAQNFWVQLSVDIEARRKLSAKVMPNL